MSFDPQMNPLYWYKKLQRIKKRAIQLEQQLDLLRKENRAHRDYSEAHKNGYQQLCAAQGMVHQIMEETNE